MICGFAGDRQCRRCALLLISLFVFILFSPSLSAQTSKTLLSSSTALYARLVRTAHSANSNLNGRIVASVTAFPNGVGEEDIYASTNSTSFTKIGAITDAEFSGGLCCGTLYELPQQVGSLPAGTLIWSGSVGQSSSTAAMKLKVYASQDGGASWSYLSTIAVTSKVGTTGGGLWEPQFTVATDGALVAFFSDETLSGHSQLLRQMRSYDGLTWKDSTYTVATSLQSDRPGMAVVSVLPSGLYFMTYEMCGPAACAVYYRTSNDGWNWGDATNAGTRIVNTKGQYFVHTPMNVWAPSSVNPNGTILLVGQMLYESTGTVSSSNGQVTFINHSADGSGTWTTMAAPVAVPTAYDNYCPNYSSPLLPSTDGQSVLEFASDYVNSTCVMYYASGPITGGATKSTVTVTPTTTNVTSLPMDVNISVTGQSGQPTGTVTLSTGSWSSSATTIDSSGAAKITLPAGSLASGTVTLTATYSGDANFASATGTSSLTVAPSAVPALKIAATAVTVQAGATSGNTSTIIVTPQAGFTDSVTLTATLTSSPSNASTLPSLSFGSTSPVTVSGSSAGTATLTVTTQAASTYTAKHESHHHLPAAPLAYAGLLSLMLLGKVRRQAIRLGSFVALLLCVSLLPGCGGSGSSASRTVTVPATSSGAYVVTVTATSGSTTATTTFNLTVN